MTHKLFIMNFGSTSTKVAVFEDEKELAKETLRHSQDVLNQFENVIAQKDFRKEAINEFLKNNNYKLDEFDCIVVRGAPSKPIDGGIYAVTDVMLNDLKSGKYGYHASCLGCIVGDELAKSANIPIITADTPATDELCSLARYTGLKGMDKKTTFHALNHKAIARQYAKEHNTNYEDLNLIVAHLGGGISVGAHEKGKVIDTNNALDGDGTFSPERAGTLPTGALVELCFSGNYTIEEIKKMLAGQGGTMSYLGTNDGLEIEKRIDAGDGFAKEVFEAMAYQISKEIGSDAAVLCGKVDAILLTGSLAYSKMLTNWIKERVEFIAPVFIYAGENEMLSLAQSGIRFLEGEKLKTY